MNITGRNASVNERALGLEDPLKERILVRYFGENRDDNDFPLAYLITVRTYGTWLHGDDRGSVDTHHGYNVISGPKRPPSDKMLRSMTASMKDAPVILDELQRAAVKEAIEKVCRHRDYLLYAANVRTNHFHVVSSLSKDLS